MPIDLDKYKDAFFSEAKTLIKIMNSSLIELEKDATRKDLLQEIYRSAHTLKSLAGTMNYRLMMDLCHAMEDLLEAVKENKVKIEACVDVLFRCFDFLNTDLKFLEDNQNELDPQSLRDELKKNLKIEPDLPAKKIKPGIPLTSLKLEKIKTIEVKVERLDVLINLAEELLISKMQLEVIRENTENPELSTAVESLGRLITEIQFHVMQIRMVPMGFIFNRFSRMTRDIAKQQKKEVNLEFIGSDIEIDRLLIDVVSEAVSHLVRNAIDHGIESPTVRKKNNKSPEGTLQLCARRTKDTVEIEVRDDGAGLNLSEIRESAVAHGKLNRNAKNQDVINTIFSGISSKKIATEISGRGLGLEIVKQKIEDIGGTIRVETTEVAGTAFIMVIPLSVAIIRTLFVQVAGDSYAIPIDVIDRMLVVNEHEIKGLMNNEAIIVADNNIPLLRLAELFHHQTKTQSRYPVVVVHHGNERLGIVVDSLLSTQEIVIKPLARAVKNNRFFSGAALLGSGEMVLILDINSLFQTKQNLQAVENT